MRILEITTSGMKNLAKDIIIAFANSTIDQGIKKVNNIKGIFGCNGAGKTAFIASVDLYRNVVLNPTYLLQNETMARLNKVLNVASQTFHFAIVYEYQRNVVIKHELIIKKGDHGVSYYIDMEDISISNGRSIQGPYRCLFHKQGHEFSSSGFNPAELDYASIVYRVISRLSESMDHDEQDVDEEDLIMMHLYANIRNIEVYLSNEDRHNHSVLDQAIARWVFGRKWFSKNGSDTWGELYADEVTIDKASIGLYEEENRRLERFIKLFKPEIKAIMLDKSEDRNHYYIKRVFAYEGYDVAYEYESAGIKQLVKLFTHLSRCAKGAFAFIDEIDTNINTVYFSKLISFFKTYGKGQLVFTTHNIEAMNALKGQSRSIVVIGEDNKIDTWVGKGNKSPTRDYLDGFFPNSPMNVEDFDFVNIFLGED